MKVTVSRPEKPIDCEIALGGSKSISNRALVIRSLCEEPFGIVNCSDAEDTALLAGCLANIDAEFFDVNHAGTSFRFLTALFSIIPGTRVLSGSGRLKQRPVKELVDVMRSLGAEISYLEREGFAPLRISGRKLRGGRTEIRGDISSQFISALLLIGPYLENGLELCLTTDLVSKPYVDMTVAIMREFGAQINETVAGYHVGTAKYGHNGRSFTVESDWSSAGYWYAITSLSNGARIRLTHFDKRSLQADRKLTELFEELGVSTEFGNGSITLRNVSLKAESFDFDFIECPDTAQTLAVTCAARGIPARLEGLQTLKVKETDRIAALQNELTKFGISVAAAESGIAVSGTAKHANTTVETYHDHRMAMSFAPLACKLGSITISDPKVVDKSYPGFWDDLSTAGFNILFIEEA